MVISSYLAANIVDEVFAAPSQYSSLEILIAVYAYAVQIYADFAGYTDIAIGIALLLGFKFPQNFDSPYAAVSLQDFWRRWHMTSAGSATTSTSRSAAAGAARRSRTATCSDMLLRALARRGVDVRRLGLIHGLGLCAERFWRERHGTKPQESFTWVDYLWRRSSRSTSSASPGSSSGRRRSASPGT